jgi:hypothetical protein
MKLTWLRRPWIFCFASLVDDLDPPYLDGMKDMPIPGLHLIKPKTIF